MVYLRGPFHCTSNATRVDGDRRLGFKSSENLESEMKIESHPVVVYTINPASGNQQVVEVTNLLAVPATFYDYTGDPDVQSEVDPVNGFITLIGGRSYRLRPIPPEQIQQQADGVNAILEVLVPWDQIEWKEEPNDG